MKAHTSHDFYARPSRFTDPGQRMPVLNSLPSEVDELVKIVQGLVIYDVVASEFYGAEISDQRGREIHLRFVRELLDRLLAADGRPLTESRPPDRRLVGRCHHFVVLLLAMLRSKQIPARARCGFADYFNPGYFEDHWVCEYWDVERAGWILVDAQLDEVRRERLAIDFDLLDEPRDRFLVAGDAWSLCRSGASDPSKFGIHHADLRGLWFVAGDVVRDVAALNQEEMLPWDVWGVQPRPDQRLDDTELAYFDDLAALSRDPDARFVNLRETYEQDEGIRLPKSVWNALTNRAEDVA